MMDGERAERLIERGTIEIAPLAFMRGRTLNDAFVILDEAQNTSSEQMKMFLTRLGFGSKAVVTGDITQIDLPPGKTSGLVEAIKVVGQRRGHRVRLLRRARRGAPQGRAADRARPTRPTRRAATGAAAGQAERAMTAAPLGAAAGGLRRRGDEPHAPAGRACPGSPPGSPASRRPARAARCRWPSWATRAIRALNRRAPREGRADRRAVVSVGRAARSSGDIVIADRRRAPAGPRAPATRSASRRGCSRCTASCTCSATTTKRDGGRMARARGAPAPARAACARG